MERRRRLGHDDQDRKSHPARRRNLPPRDRLARSYPSSNSGPWLHSDSRGHKSGARSEEHTSELQSRRDLVCRLLLEKKNSYHSLLCYNKLKLLISTNTDMPVDK